MTIGEAIEALNNYGCLFPSDKYEAIEIAIDVLQEKIEEREDLPYDAFGDYSHNPQPNTYAGRTNVKEFVADEWYKENFGGRD